MVSIQNLSVEFSARPLFTNINCVVNKSDRIALVGKNGAGKSTLLKIIAGLQQPTSGNIGVPEDFTIGYLPQQMEVSDDTSIFNEVRKVFGKAIELNAQIEKVTQQLADATDYESPEYAKLIDRLTFLNERLAVEESDNMDAEIEKTLIGLGFKREELSRPTSELSGGWRMRVELAKILLQRPDLLLLDEPTNHLDIESIQWLESFLSQKSKSVILVSHDRAFIDNVTNRTLEISCGQLYDYKVNYSRYVELRAERLEHQLRAYENQQKQIADIKDFIERFRYKPTKAVQVQSRIKQLEKIISIEVDEVDTSRLNLKFPPAPRSGDFPLIVDNVGKAYGDHRVFSGATFTLRRGDKVAFVGKNGEGKSTLVKCIMNQISHEGEIKIGHNVKIGYFAQNQAQLLDGEITVFDTIDRVAVGDIRTKIRDILGAFMFGGEASEKKVKVLSGGEKTRLAMIKLLLEPMNLLILDEPTNHLDMKTKDILKDAVKAFDGTVIVVSHDREFLDGLVDKVYEFGSRKVIENLGGIYDFLRKKKISALEELEHTSKPTPSKIDEKKSNKEAEKTGETATSGNRTKTYAEQREYEKFIRRSEKAIKDSEAKIATMESAIAELESKIGEGDTSSETLEEYDRLTRQLENEMSVWELAQMRLDEIKGS